MTKGRSLSSVPSQTPQMPESTDASKPFILGGITYRMIFDMQAIGIIIAQTKYNPLSSGLEMNWLTVPKNLAITIRAGLQRYHGGNKKVPVPTDEEILREVTANNFPFVTLALGKAMAPAQPTAEEMESIGIDVEALKLKIAEMEGEKSADPLNPPMTTGSDSGSSDEATYG